jgi:hypothetical protein
MRRYNLHMPHAPPAELDSVVRTKEYGELGGVRPRWHMFGTSLEARLWAEENGGEVVRMKPVHSEGEVELYPTPALPLRNLLSALHGYRAASAKDPDAGWREEHARRERRRERRAELHDACVKLVEEGADARWIRSWLVARGETVHIHQIEVWLARRRDGRRSSRKTGLVDYKRAGGERYIDKVD